VARTPGPLVQVLFLGRLSERKGVPELVQALAHATLASLPWHATLAGDGDLDRFKALARSAGVADRIAFPGWLDRTATANLLRAADILVLPSHDEGMAMSVLEGMAYQLCVICTPVGALAEVIEDNVSGMLVQPGNIGDLVAALSIAIREPERRERLARAGEALFRRSFEAGGYARRMIALYQQAVLAPRR
jgi:glycosyltransferase involved in cell wall biosynthesis